MKSDAVKECKSTQKPSKTKAEEINNKPNKVNLTKQIGEVEEEQNQFISKSEDLKLCC